MKRNKAARSADQETSEVETEITFLSTLSSDPGHHRSRVSHVSLGMHTALRGALAVLDIAEIRIVR